MASVATHEQLDELVAYFPPKSVGHGHGSRIRDARKVWRATQQFLEIHAHAELTEPLKLTVWGASEWTDKAVSEEALEEATTLFKSAPKVSGIFSNWELPRSALSDAIEFAFRDEQRAKQSIGPVALYLSYRIEWKALPPPVRRKGEHYFHGTKLGVSIGGRKMFFQPTFLFPLPFQSTRLHRILAQLEQDLPFKFRDDFFQRVVPKKSGEGDKLVKLPKGWRSAT